jgi:hypothetical protein
MKLKYLLFLFCILTLGTACKIGRRIVFDMKELYTKPVISYYEKKIMARNFYDALWNYDIHLDKVQELLEAGADPNYCKGDTGWFDANPLNVITAKIYLSEWGNFENDEEFPEIRALRLLLSYGADIHRRPYVWFRVNEFGNEYVNRELKSDYWNAASPLVSTLYEYDEVTNQINHELQAKRIKEVRELAYRLEKEDCGREEKFKRYVDACNRLLKALLEAGADPDQKGHPYPFTLKAWKDGMTDKLANKYFATGTRAINEAIEKGIMWESQVDLLLQYTQLDAESLLAAKRSDDPRMIEKIEALWKKQLEKRGISNVMGNDKKLSRKLFIALQDYSNQLAEVEKILEKGADPNYCEGDNGWKDGNPLNIIIDSNYIRENNEAYQNTPDILAVKLLVGAGADIHRRPYIWYRVNEFNNEYLEREWSGTLIISSFPNLSMPEKVILMLSKKLLNAFAEKIKKQETDEITKEEQKKILVGGCNKLLKILLELGADPDQRGHPHPFTLEALKDGMTDELANKYFATGTRAINEAIEKGIMWESQVDLLLQYTQLDEESLQAAKRSDDPRMIEKIEALWKKQLEGEVQAGR